MTATLSLDPGQAKGDDSGALSGAAISEYPLLRDYRRFPDGVPMSDDREFLERQRQGARQAQEFFGNKGLSLRERTIVHGLLKVLRVEHLADEIVKAGPEPIDVRFREACFQVVMMVDKDRRIGDDYKKREQQAAEATSIYDLLEPATFDRRPIEQTELLKLVVDAAEKKVAKYGRAFEDVDLLVAVNLTGRIIQERTPYPPVPKLCKWRSASVVHEGFGVVLWASASAPAFLRERLGQPFTMFEGGTIFDLAE